MKLLWLNDALNLKAENDRERDTLRLLYGSLLSLTEEEKQVTAVCRKKRPTLDRIGIN